MNFFWSFTDKRLSRTIVAERFSIALMISLSDFAEVEQTETHADVSFGALITTVFFTDFAVFADVIWVFPFLVRLAE